MPLRNVVDNECGSVNPMVGLSKHFIKDNAFHERKHLANTSVASSANYGPIGSDVQQFVNEFIADRQDLSHTNNDQPFRMDSLLREVQRLDDNSLIDHSFGVFDPKSKQWSQEFCAEEELNNYKYGFGAECSPQLDQDLADAKWADEYLAETERQLIPNALQSSIGANQWSEEFESKESSSLTEEANKLIETMDPSLNDTEFVQFIKKIGNSEISVDSDGFVMCNSTTTDKWAQDFAQTSTQRSDNWSQEFSEQKTTKEEEYEYEDDSEFWNKLAKDWKEMGLVDDTSDVENQWISEYNNTSEGRDDYKFNDQNPLREHPNPFEEGLKKLKEGDIPSAVLLFEAAVQKDSSDAKAWHYLGTTQAENEHDSAAIAALNKCLSLEPNDLKSLMSLAVSYTNESMQTQACNALKEWIKRNPKYQNLLPQDMQQKSEPFSFGPPYAVSSIITSGQHKEVKDLFISAARQSPTDVDADVQCGLGVLFNLSGEYDKAADCFQAALQVRPNDSLLWNRLGATLANGSQSEEAINAYREALSISPGFIRSRFNLGISCINLGAYREAAEHFLTVLNVQAAGRGPVGSRPLMSANVWSTLRMVTTLMNRTDLLAFVDNRDLGKLNNEFQMTDQNT